ncbi:sensor histidine kinase [Caulobacter sp.]|uniref:sensor histidine kinase n=1 Tax=Caulobacter sp. TaxID=78 RepID=UPI002B48D8C9|nr:HWE histidine kinase domain-containing protein [Caulobacter sp.]HJV40035.1 HWE histidine kinase domain-containing protein [Caulobacter sp.]
MLDLAPSNAVDSPDSGLTTLIETIEALSATRTIGEVADVIRTAARRISGADGVAFVLRDQNQCWYFDEDAIGPLWKGRRFPISACISGWAMLNRETVVIPDIYADARIPHDAYRPTFVKSLVVTPVRLDDPVAAIGAYWAHGHTPSPEVVQRLQVMARATASALESGRLNDSLTESKEHGVFLLQELDHRVKNTLAIVQSIARQTLRASPSPEAFAEVFEDRILALSQAHELLTRRSWGRAQLEEILQRALTPFSADLADRFDIGGPAVAFTAETAVSVHMTIHELVVNAAKHGALSTADGRVAIRWEIDEAVAPPVLTLTWRETGGPPLAGSPTRRGFGSKMIQQGLARDLGGAATLDFPPSGVVYTFRAPLSPRMSLAA